MIKVNDITFEYIRRDENDNVVGLQTALDNISFEVKEGDFVAILGHNGSGKSTLAKQINALLVPEKGTVYVDGIDTSDGSMVFDVRKAAGMVFQNPDNQIVYSVVEEDVGFGPENIGLPTKKILQRVTEALSKVGMLEERKKSPNLLSGGEKQKVAIAGVLAMHPKCIVFDESTAMLDPRARMEILKAVKELNENENITILWITHHMDEVVSADKVIVMNKGTIVMEGAPKQIFSQVEKLYEYKLDVPQVTMLAYELQKKGFDLPDGILTVEELVDNVVATRK